jgi:hypothetical protein
MALYIDGDKFGFNQANRLLTLQASSQGLTDPGLNEVLHTNPKNSRWNRPSIISQDFNSRWPWKRT